MYLFAVLYHPIKDVLDEESMQWLCLVHLAVSVRDAILHPSQSNFSDVLQSIKINGALFPSQALHKKLTADLNLSVSTMVLCM